MNKKSGVTLIILIVTIIVMIIILGITVSSFNDLLKNTQRDRLKTNLYLIKARAEVLLEDFKFQFENELEKNNPTISTDNIEKYLGGTLIPSSSREVLVMGFPSASSKVYYCAWDMETLRNQGIDTSNIASNDVFVIRYDLSGSAEEVALEMEQQNTDLVNWSNT